ncbi:hypothetical protein [Candidatus Methylacidiphilum fumarolicum]|nr:hypothetical protein [Candidatus Methylacidiphilum fumarolicum]
MERLINRSQTGYRTASDSGIERLSQLVKPMALAGTLTAGEGR